MKLFWLIVHMIKGGCPDGEMDKSIRGKEICKKCGREYFIFYRY
jgi:hypothetical protein